LKQAVGLGKGRLGKGACCWAGDRGGVLCLAPCPTQRLIAHSASLRLISATHCFISIYHSGALACILSSAPCTLHPAPCTLHPVLCRLPVGRQIPGAPHLDSSVW